MYDRLQAVEDRYDELNELLSDPDVVSDPKRLRDLSKEQSGITATVETYREYKNVNEQINETKELLGEKLDDEMREMAKEEFAELQKEKADLEERLKLLLVPKDPNDDKNVILEIRGAAGGDEAALFAGDLFRMYSKYAESRGWKVEIMDA
ncbi:PCRF domain-containing protein, partial [Listeria monocytogenes]|nr:PCRF domain-containing protein [Listeria monocytogenes]